eukprot:gene8575-11587_t
MHEKSHDMMDDSEINFDRQKFNKPDINGKEAESSNDKFVTFERWLTENGTNLTKLELQDYGNEVRGCHTMDDVDDDEIIIEVPLKCLITVEMGKDTEVGRKILSSNIELDAPKHIFLMVFMLVDRKNPHSFFKPYYEILPKTLSNMPIFWNQEELKYLTGSYLLEQIDERNAAIEADYMAICSIAPEFSSISTLQEFKWARMCVCSRNFGLVINGLQTAALVPYADMLNHYRPRETKWQFDDNLQGFTVVALQKIGAGCQVYDSYGRKCNHRFLLNYGFSVENNIESDGFCPNETPILLELKKSDPLYESKCSYWRRDFSIPSRRIRVSVGENETTKIMFALLRIIEADKDDFDMLISCAGSSSYRSIRDAQIPISIKNEIRAMNHLAFICDDYLYKYPTTFEQDCMRLAVSGPGQVPPFSNERHALIQVKGEKEILLFYKDFAITAIKLLQLSDSHGNNSSIQLENVLENIRATKHSLIYQYCRSNVTRLLQDESRRAEIKRRNLDLSKPTVV